MEIWFKQELMAMLLITSFLLQQRDPQSIAYSSPERRDGRALKGAL
jgi:hypothetical protein